jgi:hypothetical protein
MTNINSQLLQSQRDGKSMRSIRIHIIIAVDQECTKNQITIELLTL